MYSIHSMNFRYVKRKNAEIMRTKILAYLLSRIVWILTCDPFPINPILKKTMEVRRWNHNKTLKDERID